MEWVSEQVFNPSVQVQSKTKANRDVEVKAQISGRVVSVPARRGSKIAAGELICEVDQEDRHASNRSAKAAVQRAELEHAGALSLKERGVQSELAIARSLAGLESAKAQQKQTQRNVDNLRIVAPFDGVLENRPLEVGDYVQPGHLCGTVVELDPIRIVGQVSAADIGDIKRGQKARFIVSEDNIKDANITFLAHQADPVTRTFKLEAESENPGGLIRAGIAGTLVVDTEVVKAHLIPASVLLLDDEGDLLVKALAKGNLVSPVNVKNVGVSDDGIWVTGLPKRVALITMGQNYVEAGEEVEPVFTELPLSDHKAD